MTFGKFAQACGVLVEDLSPSHCIRRCGTTLKPKSKNGSYLFDGKRGWVQAWDGDGEIHFYGDKTEFTEADKKEWAKRKREAELQRDKVNDTAALKAAILLRGTTMLNHAYLARKGFKEELGFVDEAGRLLVPMRDCITNDLRGLQAVEWIPDERKFTKKMQHGMKAKGAIFRIGNKTAFEAFLVEGYATGLSVAAACRQLRLNASVVCCFSDSNLVYVASLIGGKKFIYADNDVSLAGEKAAIKTALPYCMSDVVSEDANDQHQRAGILSVCQKIIEVRRI